MLILYRVGAPLCGALSQCRVAVAGTREPTPHGRRLARELGRRLAEAGYAVVTGFARGVDEEAALGALEGGGRVVAVLPYLVQEDGRLSWRASRLLRSARERGAHAAVVAENLVEDGGRVREWLAARNRVIVRLADALVVPEARFRRRRWGTRYAVEHALAMGRLVVAFRPRVGDGGVAEAFEHFRRRGAVAAGDINEALGLVARTCRSRPLMV